MKWSLPQALPKFSTPGKGTEGSDPATFALSAITFEEGFSHDPPGKCSEGLNSL